MDGKKGLLVSYILLMVATSPAFAALSAYKGWYLEGSVGSSNVVNKHYPGNASRSGVGGGGTVGYKFMRFFATELGYTMYANSNITDPSTTITAAFDRHYAWDIAFKGIFPVYCTGFELFGKLGVSQLRSSLGINNQAAANNLLLGPSSHTANGPYVGAGVQYYFSPAMAVNLQYARAQGDSYTGNASLISFGLSLLFG